MTKKLESLFDLADSDHPQEISQSLTTQETREVIADIDTAIDKIDAALPAVRDLDTSDQELDELATLARDKFNDLMDLGMNVDSRFASEIFGVASNMLGHALTAKTAKLNKKLKMIDLQLRKARLDQTASSPEDESTMPTAEGHVLSRNELLDRLLGDRKQNNKKE
jgi:uncharacterized protein YoxC